MIEHQLYTPGGLNWVEWSEQTRNCISSAYQTIFFRTQYKPKIAVWLHKTSCSCMSNIDITIL